MSEICQIKLYTGHESTISDGSINCTCFHLIFTQTARAARVTIDYWCNHMKSARKGTTCHNNGHDHCMIIGECYQPFRGCGFTNGQFFAAYRRMRFGDVVLVGF